VTPEAIAVAQAHGLSPEEVARVLDSLKRRVHCFIDPTAKLHPTAKVWHYATVLAGVELAEGVQIGSHTEVGRGTKVGKNSRIGANVFLPPYSVIGEEVFIGPSVSCADDRWPYIHKQFDAPYEALPPTIEDGATVGLGAVLLPGVRIGRGAVVGAGTVVTADVPAGCLIRGEPGRIRVPQELSEDAQKFLADLAGVHLAIPST
jgi:UDP-2-acetamido-3-amino-2,3-dideoxy-glucuronate N-acetyltransferase